MGEITYPKLHRLLDMVTWKSEVKKQIIRYCYNLSVLFFWNFSKDCWRSAQRWRPRCTFFWKCFYQTHLSHFQESYSFPHL